LKRLVTTPEAYQLLHEGTLALSEVEANGVRVDKAYVERSLVETEHQINEASKQLKDDPIYTKWRKRYGENTNLFSYEQLSEVMFKVEGYKPKRKKKQEPDDDPDKRESASEASFEGIDLPFLKLWFNTQKIRKANGTYLRGIQREMVCGANGEWFVHPHYHLNTTITHRSSCSDPNWQNNPVRNPMLYELIRRCYIPRSGNHFLELDHGQVEVRVPCFYNFDPVLMDYVSDPKKDMHRDMAMQIFKLKAKQVSKECRHIAKNDFVFPTFYGSYYAQCAPHCWEALEHRSIKIEGTDTLVRDHLASVGITELGECDPDESPVKGTFEYHLKEIEDDFWGRRFKVYAQWKRDWWEQYQRNGGFQMLSGFAVNMPLDRKQVCNSPIQGVAFHLALWALIRINRRLRRYKFQSRVIGEIHDCINLDGPPKERDNVIEICTEIMTRDILKVWPWINVPLVVEPEMCPIDQPWFYKRALVERNGTWVPGDMDKWEKSFGEWSLQS
jgi:DNA polymerase I-like protein with 3'-5' exonuclease and polymerase domains